MSIYDLFVLMNYLNSGMSGNGNGNGASETNNVAMHHSASNNYPSYYHPNAISKSTGFENENAIKDLTSASSELQRSSVDMSTLQLSTVNKCCPIHQHYKEDDSHRLKCSNVTRTFSAVSIDKKGFKLKMLYSCQTTMGFYINNFDNLSVNGVGDVTYKGKRYEKYCLDFDTYRDLWILMLCSSIRPKPNTISTTQLKAVSLTQEIPGKIYDLEDDISKNLIETKRPLTKPIQPVSKSATTATSTTTTTTTAATTRRTTTTTPTTTEKPTTISGRFNTGRVTVGRGTTGRSTVASTTTTKTTTARTTAKPTTKKALQPSVVYEYEEESEESEETDNEPEEYYEYEEEED